MLENHDTYGRDFAENYEHQVHRYSSSRGLKCVDFESTGEYKNEGHQRILQKRACPVRLDPQLCQNGTGRE